MNKHYTPGRPGNYLRVRGEYSITPLVSRSDKELPPRARRIPVSQRHILA